MTGLMTLHRTAAQGDDCLAISVHLPSNSHLNKVFPRYQKSEKHLLRSFCVCGGQHARALFLANSSDAMPGQINTPSCLSRLLAVSA